jgi:hypothetical protein
MNYTVKNTFTIKDETFTSLYKLAEKEYLSWEKKNSRKENQCYNTLSSCLVGVLSEYAGMCYVKQVCDITNSLENSTFHWLGKLERERGVGYIREYKDRGDFFIKTPKGKTLDFEVKGCRSHHQLGQILPYHVNKYNKNKINYIIFVCIDEIFEHENGSVTLTVYSVEAPKTILTTWNNSLTNYYGKTCYTNPDYMQGNTLGLLKLKEQQQKLKEESNHA